MTIALTGPVGHTGLARRLGVVDAVVIGLSAMIGAGVYAVVRACSARRRQPAPRRSGRRRSRRLLQRHLVGAACRAVPLVGRHLCLRPGAAGRVVGLPGRVGLRRREDRVVRGDGAHVRGVRGRRTGVDAAARRAGGGRRADHRELPRDHKTSGLARVLLSITVVALVVGGGDRLDVWTGPSHLADGAGSTGGVYGVLQSAGLLFFAFAGYARIATLGEEVATRENDPARHTAGSGIAARAVRRGRRRAPRRARPQRLAASASPLDTAASGVAEWLGWLVRDRCGRGRARCAARAGGRSRPHTLAMARNHDLPGFLDGVHPRHQVPHRAEVAVGLVVGLLVLTTDLRGVIGFSSFGVLLYYAVANASAFTQTRSTAAGRRRCRSSVCSVASCWW